jgi:hypothetical protein
MRRGAHPAPDRDDRRHGKAQLWAAADALAGAGQGGLAGAPDRYGLQSAPRHGDRESGCGMSGGGGCLDQRNRAKNTRQARPIIAPTAHKQPQRPQLGRNPRLAHRSHENLTGCADG